MKKAVFIICLTFLLANFGFCEIKTFSKTVKLEMGERDSRDQLRAQATLEAKRQALEEAGAYIQSVVDVKQIFTETNTAYSEDYFKQIDLLAIAASVSSVKVINEEWKMEGSAVILYLTCQVTLETAEVKEKVRSLLADKQKWDGQKELQEENQRLRKDLEDLKRRLEKVEAAQVPILTEEKNKLTQQYTAQEWFDKGLAATNLEDQINFYTEAIHLSPDWTWPYNNRGNAYSDKGDYEQAIRDFNQALKLNPNYAEAYYNRGNAYALKGDYEQAIRDYNQALKLNPNDAEAYNNRGIAYAKKGDYEQAINDFNQALKLDPNYAEAYNNRGIAYAKKGDYEQAIRDYNQALKLNPNYAEAYINRGNAYYDKGDYEQAISDYNQALKLNPNYAGAYYNRGIAYYFKGDLQKARQDFLRAKALGHPKAQKALDLLEK
jgi:tetratricopeptide (TPR) repeat protein